MSLRILAVGKKHEDWIEPGLIRYEKRLERKFQIKWDIIAHSAKDGLQARQNESEQLYKHIRPDDFVILLDERGHQYDSPGLTQLIETQLTHARPIVFIIGGAYGVDDMIMTRANVIWSLSKLVFPHQLVRLLLVEQLYRAQEITLSHPYHHQ